MAKSLGALALDSQKCGSSRFTRSKVWELSLYTTKSVGALALDAQKYGGSRLKRPKVWELSQNAHQYGSSHLKRHEKKAQRVTGRHKL